MSAEPARLRRLDGLQLSSHDTTCEGLPSIARIYQVCVDAMRGWRVPTGVSLVKAQRVLGTFVERIHPLAQPAHQKLHTMANSPSSCCCLPGAAGCFMEEEEDWKLEDSKTHCSADGIRCFISLRVDRCSCRRTTGYWLTTMLRVGLVGPMPY